MKIELNDKQVYKAARRSLIRLLQDSLELNRRSNLSYKEIDYIEGEIIEDFLIVMDYLKIVGLHRRKSTPPSNSKN